LSTAFSVGAVTPVLTERLRATVDHLVSNFVLEYLIIPIALPINNSPHQAPCSCFLVKAVAFGDFADDFFPAITMLRFGEEVHFCSDGRMYRNVRSPSQVPAVAARLPLLRRFVIYWFAAPTAYPFRHQLFLFSATVLGRRGDCWIKAPQIGRGFDIRWLCSLELGRVVLGCFL
jgi:hypothetical protein